MTRVTTFGNASSMLFDLAGNQRALIDVQRRIASGKRLQRGSDGPAEVVTALDHRARLARSEQLGRNANQARQWLGAADTVTQTIVGRLSEARALLVQANSGAMDATSREALANQLADIRQSLLESANTKVMGRPLFGGTSSTTTAYDDAGTYLGDEGAVTVPVSPGVTITVSRTGPQVFGTHDPNDPANGDVFQQLDALVAAVRDGDTAAISAGFGQIDAAMRRIEVVQVELGSRMVQVEDLRAAAAVMDLETKAALSELEDVDYAEAAIALKSREAAYHAALAVTAQVIQPSLLDFLR